MFFNTSQVNNFLLCKYCEGKLDIPKILPCGQVICSLCESLIHILMYYKKYDCFLCKDKHEMPNEELPIVKPLLEILALKLSNVSRGQTYDSLMKLLNEIHKKK